MDMSMARTYTVGKARGNKQCGGGKLRMGYRRHSGRGWEGVESK